MNRTVKVNCVTEGGKTMRLDRFLSSKFEQYSRTYLQKLIDHGLVWINGKTATKPSFSIKDKDEVCLEFAPQESYSATPEKVEFGVVALEDEFIVVDKPHGLIVHRGVGAGEEPTLAKGLLYLFEELKKFDDQDRPGIVHRLDKNTSGLLLVARNPAAQFQISQLFKNRAIEKTYLALVEGHPEREGKIEFPIGRHPVKRHMMARDGINSRASITHYKVLDYFADSSLVEVKIVTGRTHQIRVHFAAIGHSIVGDETYGKKSKLIGRQALHSHKISFEYKEKNYSYTSLIPEDFEKCLVEYRKKNF